MGYVNVSLSNVKEPEIVPEGEYELRIVKVNDTESKAKNPMTVVTIAIEDAGTPNPPMPINHYLTPPVADTPADQAYMRVLDIKRFLRLFGIPFEDGGFDSQDLVGATAKCFVSQEEGNDGVVRNRLKLPRLKD